MLFNYIIYNKPYFENFAETDHQAIINILKKLEIFIDNPGILKYFSESQMLEYKLQYWAIKEIYFSPHRVFLNELTEKQFIYRFHKAKKYMDYTQCSIYEFIAYFIHCVQEEMEIGGKVNDRKE